MSGRSAAEEKTTEAIWATKAHEANNEGKGEERKRAVEWGGVWVGGVSLEELMTGLVTICVWIEPICPKTVDTVKYKHKVHQTYPPNFEV